MPGNLVQVQFAGSIETEIWLEARLREARRQQLPLLGIAAITMYSHSDYALSIKGEIRKSPIITRGMLPELDYLFARIVRGH